MRNVVPIEFDAVAEARTERNKAPFRCCGAATPHSLRAQENGIKTTSGFHLDHVFSNGAV